MAETTIHIKVDTSDLEKKLKIIAKHLTALADDLQAPDSIITVDGELTEERRP